MEQQPLSMNPQQQSPSVPLEVELLRTECFPSQPFLGVIMFASRIKGKQAYVRRI